MVQAQAGKSIKVRVSFTDNAKFSESLTSPATAAVLGTGVTKVPLNWSLVPKGFGVGSKFRLLFVSSTSRDAESTSIFTYNTFVQNRVAAGHTDIN